MSSGSSGAHNLLREGCDIAQVCVYCLYTTVWEMPRLYTLHSVPGIRSVTLATDAMGKSVEPVCRWHPVISSQSCSSHRETESECFSDHSVIGEGIVGPMTRFYHSQSCRCQGANEL